MKTTDFNYFLPPERIAQKAIEPRDHSRLLVISRKDGAIEHRLFYEIVDYLQAGDVLVCNDSRVIHARLRGYKVDSGAKIELFLLRRLDSGVWETLAKPARRLKEGTVVILGTEPMIEATVLNKTETGTVVVDISNEEVLDNVGAVPLPPYIRRPLNDPERYQTVYSCNKGSVAAPTAGLHFTPELMKRVEAKGASFVFVTLHLALDSFRPVSVHNPHDHIIHKEYGELTPEVAIKINQARAEGRRIICVGTSSMRVLEHAARTGQNDVTAFIGWTDLFILPGHEFKVADAMITNFHLPCSTLLMLVSAFMGRDHILQAYEEAIRHEYRFYSFGDSMFIV